MLRSSSLSIRQLMIIVKYSASSLRHPHQKMVGHRRVMTAFLWFCELIIMIPNAWYV